MSLFQILDSSLISNVYFNVNSNVLHVAHIFQYVVGSNHAHTHLKWIENGMETPQKQSAR